MSKKLLEEIEQLKAQIKAQGGFSKKYKPIEIKASAKKVKTRATAVLLASDWHVDEIVKASTVNGLNNFNWTTAQERVNNFWNNAIKLYQMFEKETQIDGIVIGLLGDFFSGHIHLDLHSNTSFQPVEAVWRVQNLIAGGIKEFSKLSKRVAVVCCDGNHSRINEKKSVSNAYGNSLETLMYLHLSEQIPNVHWHIGEGYHKYVKIYDFILRFHHGDYVRYGGGIGGLTIPMNKAIAAWDKAKPSTLDACGHFHTRFDGGKFVVNGSLIGYNAFALSIKASYERPQQTMFLVDSDFGKTIVSPVFCDR
jgi:hypothetical protein